jgi:hypothetical protein
MISVPITPDQRGLFDMLTENADENHASFTMDTVSSPKVVQFDAGKHKSSLIL